MDSLLIGLQSSEDNKICAKRFVEIYSVLNANIHYENVLEEVLPGFDYDIATKYVIEEITYTEENHSLLQLLDELLPLCDDKKFIYKVALDSLKNYPLIIYFYLKNYADDEFIQKMKDIITSIPKDNKLYVIIAKELYTRTNDGYYLFEAFLSKPCFATYFDLWNVHNTKDEREKAYEILMERYNTNLLSQQDYQLVRFMHFDQFFIKDILDEHDETNLSVLLLILMIHSDYKLHGQACKSYARTFYTTRNDQELGYDNNQKIDCLDRMRFYRKSIRLSHKQKLSYLKLVEKAVERIVAKSLRKTYKKEYGTAAYYVKALGNVKKSLHIPNEPEETLNQYRREYYRFTNFLKIL